MSSLHLAMTAIVLIAAAGEPPTPSAPSQACADSHRSPDYAPGIDATGHAVPPADLPTDSNLAVNTDIFVQVQTRDRKAPAVA